MLWNSEIFLLLDFHGWKVKSKVGSLQNYHHSPGGGDKKIFDKKEKITGKNLHSKHLNSIYFSKKIILANSRIGSLENRKHTPKGGTKQIENFPIRLGHVKAGFAFSPSLIFKNLKIFLLNRNLKFRTL